MLDGLLSDLLQIKWETSVRGIFRSWLLLFAVFLVISSIAYITRLDLNTASKWVARYNATTNSSGSTKTKDDQDRLAYKVALVYKLTNQYSELLVAACVAYYLFILTKRCLIEQQSSKLNNNKPRRTSFMLRLFTGSPMNKILIQAPELTIFTFNCLLVIMCIPLRLVFKWHEAEDFLAAIIMFLMPLKLLFFCRGSKSLGSFIVMIYKILVNDVLCFVVFLVIFIAGFSQCK
jgi:hypothetical protein